MAYLYCPKETGSQIQPAIAVETQQKTTRDRGALGKEDEVKYLSVTSGFERKHKAFDCDLFHLDTLFLFHICPVLSFVRSFFMLMGARFIGQNRQGKRREGGLDFQCSVS